jgi:hypothetical protein
MRVLALAETKGRSLTFHRAEFALRENDLHQNHHHSIKRVHSSAFGSSLAEVRLGVGIKGGGPEGRHGSRKHI